MGGGVGVIHTRLWCLRVQQLYCVWVLKKYYMSTYLPVSDRCWGRIHQETSAVRWKGRSPGRFPGCGQLWSSHNQPQSSCKPIIITTTDLFNTQHRERVRWHSKWLISGAFKHSVFHAKEIYALENAVFYTPYKPYTQHGMFKCTWNQLYTSMDCASIQPYNKPKHSEIR